MSTTLASRSSVGELVPFDRPTDLRVLSISSNDQLAALPSLNALTSLPSLDALANLPLLGKGSNLKHLWITWNDELQKIEGLGDLVALEAIDLGSRDVDLLEVAIEQLKETPHVQRVTLPFHTKAKALGQVLNEKRRSARRKLAQVIYQ